MNFKSCKIKLQNDFWIWQGDVNVKIGVNILINNLHVSKLKQTL